MEKDLGGTRRPPFLDLAHYLQVQESFHWGFCQECYGNYRADKREPPCIEKPEKVCVYTGESPLELEPDDRLALDIFNKTVALSGFNEMGQPKIDKLEFILDNLFPCLDTERRYDAIHKVLFIHRKLTELRNTREVKKDG